MSAKRARMQRDAQLGPLRRGAAESDNDEKDPVDQSGAGDSDEDGTDSDIEVLGTPPPASSVFAGPEDEPAERVGAQPGDVAAIQRMLVAPLQESELVNLQESAEQHSPRIPEWTRELHAEEPQPARPRQREAFPGAPYPDEVWKNSDVRKQICQLIRVRARSLSVHGSHEVRLRRKDLVDIIQGIDWILLASQDYKGHRVARVRLTMDRLQSHAAGAEEKEHADLAAHSLRQPSYAEEVKEKPLEMEERVPLRIFIHRNDFHDIDILSDVVIRRRPVEWKSDDMCSLAKFAYDTGLEYLRLHCDSTEPPLVMQLEFYLDRVHENFDGRISFRVHHYRQEDDSFHVSSTMRLTSANVFLRLTMMHLSYRIHPNSYRSIDQRDTQTRVSTEQAAKFLRGLADFGGPRHAVNLVVSMDRSTVQTASMTYENGSSHQANRQLDKLCNRFKLPKPADSDNLLVFVANAILPAMATTPALVVVITIEDPCLDGGGTVVLKIAQGERYTESVAVEVIGCRNLFEDDAETCVLWDLADANILKFRRRGGR